MERHYEYRGKIYINVDHLDDDNELVKQYLEDVGERKLLGLRPSYDNFIFELVEDNAFFKCPCCGSNRFHTDLEENKIYCSNMDHSRKGQGVNICGQHVGFSIDYDRWVEVKSKNPEWKAKWVK